MYQSKEVVERLNAHQMCERREEAVLLIHKAMEALSEADKILKTVSKYGLSFDRNTIFTPHDDTKKMRTVRDLTKQVDSKMWDKVVEIGQFRDLMTIKQQRKLSEQISQCPPFTIDTVTATLGELLNNRPNMLHDLIETSFLERSKGYKSNQGMKINKRQVINGVYDRYGFTNWGSKPVDRLNDIVKAVAVLLGCEVPNTSCTLKENSEVEEFEGKVRFKAFKNGNVHMWVECDELLNKLNDVLSCAMGAKVGSI